jgi:pimeloyl-ACP methyl ester carboxylesterase
VTFSPAVEAWRARGRTLQAAGRDVFVVEMGDGPVMLVLHGFPGSSFDWSHVMPRLAQRGFRAVAFDFLGHGLSEKPKDTPYSLFEQADVAEAVAKAAGVDRCTLVAHDMGDTVAAELLMRATEGRLGFAVDRCVLTNGSIFMHLVQLSAGQLALLSLPDETLPESLPLEGFKPGLASTFPADAQPDDAVLDDMLALIRFGDGDRVLPRVVRYIEERRANQERWTRALTAYDGPMHAIWGAQDPIAVVEMPHHLKEIRPETEVAVWDDCGHWPCIEHPQRLADAVADRAGP